MIQYLCAKLRTAMLLLLGLLGGANSTLLVSSINTLLTYLQVNSSLLFTSNDTIAYIEPRLVVIELVQRSKMRVPKKQCLMKIRMCNFSALIFQRSSFGVLT